MEQEYETIDLREIIFLLRNNAISIVASALVCALLGFLVTTFLITPQYEASATMIVNSQQNQSATNITNDMITTAKNLVTTYGIVVKSDTVLQQVIDQLNLDMTYEELQSKVAISAVDSTQVMRIAVQDANPAQAKAIVGKIVEIAPEIVRDAVEAGSVKVISDARVGDEPVSPNKMMNTAIAGLLGLALSVGAIFAKEMLNNTFKNDDDIQRHLGFTVLGVIPYVDMEAGT
ncbi:MAG: capsular biosynthesis protein [Candidatus Fournierella pullistercoris]|uniref:Capsular biosynthesis protein n=1 Tax=Candidatus Allofournierella pullistercoris TaxID=2838597 RepID=A0A948T2X6_9FIRM|nr:capsular biosynthesis protein [Candidatus Fournierella pullistercoris]